MRVTEKDFIGCCGAYCKTCREYTNNICKGCKLGFHDGTRDISKAKCKIKKCCIVKSHSTCADCPDASDCGILNAFHAKNAYKYKKYKEAITFIRAKGYKKFLSIAKKWKMQYGGYDGEK